MVYIQTHCGFLESIHECGICFNGIHLLGCDKLIIIHISLTNTTKFIQYNMQPLRRVQERTILKY